MPNPLGHKTGLSSIDDLLEIRTRSPLQLGLNTIQPILLRDLAIHNRLTNTMVGEFADITTDIRRLYGGSDVIEMIEADEFSRAHTQKGKTGSVAEFPLRGFQVSIGWDKAYFQRATVADMAQSQLAAEKGQVIKIRTEIQKAVYQAANYSFVDYRDTKVTLAVKRFLNADGLDIPDSPYGASFNAATHTHYTAVGVANAPTQAEVLALVKNVTEHHIGGRPVLIINQADEAYMRTLTPTFQAYVDSRLTLNANSNQPTDRLNPFETDDRPIGLYGAAEVWVRPWALPNYWFCFDTRAPKPLVARVRAGAGAPGLELVIAAQLDFAPLYAKYMESEFGFGVWTRTNGAVLYTGGTVYTDPVL